MSEVVPELVENTTADVLEEAAAMLNSVTVESEVTVRNLAKRELDVRMAPFGQTIQTLTGPEVIEPGDHVADPSRLLLMGLEHEVHLGVGQDGRVIPTRRPTGKAISIEQRADGAYATFRVAKTPAGDEILALADDGVIGGVSVEMGKNARYRTETRVGRRTTVVEFGDFRAVSPTYQPAYDAPIVAVRSQKEDAPVAEDKAPATGATVTEEKPEEEPRVSDVQARSAPDESVLLSQFAQAFNKPIEQILDRLEAIEERGRSSFEIPGAPQEKSPVSRGMWMETALKLLSGERIPDSQYRTVADFITTDNAGVVPDAFVNELIGVIDPMRPFMATTRRLETPDSGMSIVVPKITQRPTVGEQETEKTELASQKSIIGTETFEVHTYGGVGDISLQLLKRASRSFLALFLELLGEAYAIETEDAAVGALITAINDGGPEPAGPMDPNDLALGDAFVASFNATRRPPDSIWLSTAAIGEFIDAKASGTNAPLYSDLRADFTAAGGIGGTISGLRAVHVPALDDKGAYAIVGPSRGYAWAEDGTYTLQVDVPSKAGRDVALVGMVWHIPWYPTAFSLFNVAS